MSPAVPTVEPARVLAFRLQRAGLPTPAPDLDPGSLAPLGLQDTAATATYALALRTAAPMRGGVAAMVEDRRLVPTWGPRRAAYLAAGWSTWPWTPCANRGR